MLHGLRQPLGLFLVVQNFAAQLSVKTLKRVAGLLGGYLGSHAENVASDDSNVFGPVLHNTASLEIRSHAGRKFSARKRLRKRLS